MTKENSFTVLISGKISPRMRREFSQLIDSLGISESLALRMSLRFWIEYMNEKIRTLHEINPNATGKDIIKLYNKQSLNYLFIDLRKQLENLPVEEKIDFLFEAEIIRNNEVKTKEEIKKLMRLNLL